MKMNSKWHEENPMLKNASEDQKIMWHVQHVKYCHCRPLPPKLLAEIKKRKIEVE